jgi:hypothetical protein
MNIRCIDPTSSSAEVHLKCGSTIAELKTALESQFQFNASTCSIFTHGKSEEWTDREVIHEMEDDCPLFVFVDRTAYYEKSYPVVESAFRFPQTRFGEPPVLSLADDGMTDPANFPFVPPADPQPPAEQIFDYEIEGATIRLMAAENVAVRRLLELGFDFQAAMQVFVACDSDESAARVCLRGMR